MKTRLKGKEDCERSEEERIGESERPEAEV